jgi:hypothetical protein
MFHPSFWSHMLRDRKKKKKKRKTINYRLLVIRNTRRQTIRYLKKKKRSMYKHQSKYSKLDF